VTGGAAVAVRGILWDLDETLVVEDAAVAAAFTSAAEPGAALAGVPAADLGVAARRCARVGAGLQALWLDRRGVGSGARAGSDAGAAAVPGGAHRVESLRDLDLPALREGRLVA
jgi:hypothetical protein